MSCSFIPHGGIFFEILSSSFPTENKGLHFRFRIEFYSQEIPDNCSSLFFYKSLKLSKSDAKFRIGGISILKLVNGVNMANNHIVVKQFFHYLAANE